MMQRDVSPLDSYTSDQCDFFSVSWEIFFEIVRRFPLKLLAPLIYLGNQSSKYFSSEKIVPQKNYLASNPVL